MYITRSSLPATRRAFSSDGARPPYIHCVSPIFVSTANCNMHRVMMTNDDDDERIDCKSEDEKTQKKDLEQNALSDVLIATSHTTNQHRSNRLINQ